MKKFLLHINGSKEHHLYALYLTHLANKNLDEVELNVLMPKSSSFNYLTLSPFEVNTFSYVEEEGNSLPKAHKFAYNLHDVFNIDFFIDFDKTATSAFWGTAFRAKNKLGKASTLRKLLLTKSFEAETDQSYFDQLTAYFDWNFEFDNLKKEFEVTGDEVLVFEKILEKEFKSRVQEKFNLVELKQDDDNDKKNEILKDLEKFQFVFVNSKEDIGFFNYLNKVVVFDNEQENNDILSLNSFLNKYIEES